MGLGAPWHMSNFPGLGIKPVSPALAGRFLSTIQPGKSEYGLLNQIISVLKLLRVVVILWMSLRDSDYRIHRLK